VWKILARTTPGNIEALFPAISKAWYVLAGLEMCLGLGLSAFGWSVAAFVRDSAFFATEGYFFGRRKSRAVAVAMFALPIGQIALQVNVVGLSFGISFWLGYLDLLLAIALALRGAEVAFRYHRLRGTVIYWSRVIAICTASTFSAFFVGMAALIVLGVPSREIRLLWAVGFLLLVGYTGVAVMAALTWRYPFARIARGPELSDVFA
jgi:hypothetical protein